MKIVKIVKIIAIILTCVSCLSHPAIAATPWFNPSDKGGLYAYNPQYEKYKEIIETPLRHLKVFDSFTLVDDFDAFMSWHDKHTTGKFPESTGAVTAYREENVAVDKCLDDAKTIIGTTAIRTAIKDARKLPNGESRFYDEFRYDYVQTQGSCDNVLAQRFMNNPELGVRAYRDILKYWQENGILKNINETIKKLPNAGAYRNDFTYATRSRVGYSLAHYALYHRIYGLSQEEINNVDEMITNFVLDYDYYYAFKTSQQFPKNICDLGRAATVPPDTSNDHCGSASLRLAVGAVLYGLEFGNQIVFDYGIGLLEIALATFDEQRAYSAQMFRGMLALGYARQIVAELDKLDYAFEKAFQFDFSEMVTPHGATPAEVYKELLIFAKEPQRLAYYFSNNGYGADRRGGDFNEFQKKLTQGKVGPEVFWEDFNLRDHYILGGKMALEYYPNKFEQYMRATEPNIKWGVDSALNTGFNNLVLRQATGQIDTLSAPTSNNVMAEEIEDTSDNVLKITWSTLFIDDSVENIEGEHVIYLATDLQCETPAKNILKLDFQKNSDAFGFRSKTPNLIVKADRTFSLSGFMQVQEGENARNKIQGDENEKIIIQGDLTEGEKTFFFGPGDKLIARWQYFERQDTGKIDAQCAPTSNNVMAEEIEDTSINALKITWSTLLIDESIEYVEGEHMIYLTTDLQSETPSKNILKLDFQKNSDAFGFRSNTPNLIVKADRTFSLSGFMQVQEGENARSKMQGNENEKIIIQGDLTEGEKTFFFGPGDKLIARWQYLE